MQNEDIYPFKKMGNLASSNTKETQKTTQTHVIVHSPELSVPTQDNELLSHCIQEVNMVLGTTNSANKVSSVSSPESGTNRSFKFFINNIDSKASI